MQYDIRYFHSYPLNVNIFKDGKLNLALKLLERHIGDTFLTIITFHPYNYRQIEFSFNAIGLRTGTEEEHNEELEKENPNIVDIKLYQTSNISNILFTNTFYFKLDKNSKYIYLMLQIFAQPFVVGVSLNYSESNIPIYHVKTLKEYKIDLKYLMDNNIGHLNLKTTNNQLGDGFIKLKVKKDVPKDIFYLEGDGDNQYLEDESSYSESL